MTNHTSTSGTVTRRCLGLALTLMFVACSASAFAQGRGQRRGPAGQGDGVSSAEIQRLFDAYVAMQAQQQLQLSDEQYPKFLARMKDLQSARQRGFTARARIVQELRRLDDQPALDEAQARAQMKELADVEARSAAEVRDALAAVDQVLDLRQQVRFRIFEEQMERRKLDLLLRARQANRQRNGP